MALRMCKECGNEVSTKAASCPKCGAVIKKKNGCLGCLGTAFLIFIALGVIGPLMYDGTPTNPGSLSPEDRGKSSKTQRPQPASWESAQDREYNIQVSAGTPLNTVHDTSKREEIVLLELYSDKIAFTALVSRRKYEEVMALQPPTYLKHEGLEYVQNDLLFWGESGKAEQVSVDGEVFEGFSLASRTAQIVAKGSQVGKVLTAMMSGDRLRLEKHYWNDANEKDFPVFDIDSIREGLSELGASSVSGFTVRESETRCKSYGTRKVVWLDNPAGVFALNGPAIELVQSGSNDVPWESRGRPLQIGRDVLGTAVTAALIQAGLQKCR